MMISGFLGPWQGAALARRYGRATAPPPTPHEASAGPSPCPTRLQEGWRGGWRWQWHESEGALPWPPTVYDVVVLPPNATVADLLAAQQAALRQQIRMQQDTDFIFGEGAAKKARAAALRF